MGLYDSEQPFVFQIYLEPLAKLQTTQDLPKHLKPGKELEKEFLKKWTLYLFGGLIVIRKG